MADLFNQQAQIYVETRPTYPPELFSFIASKTPGHHLAWDVGAGSGQAAVSLANIFKDVVATDTSQQQLSFAPKLPNVRYQQTPSTMSIAELESHVASQGTVDLVTIAQALHWFDFPVFYQQVKWVLRPNGIIAAWCYSWPEVNDAVDAVFSRLYKESGPFWAPERKFVDDRYSTIDFPFQPVEGEDHTGPFRFETIRSMDLESYFTYIRSWSSYQTARGKGVDLLREDVVNDFERAWGGERTSQKMVRYPIFLKLGKLGKVFKDVVATDTSQLQLSFAPKLPNVRFQQTPPNMSIAELESHVALQGTVDLVTIAQALHWIDHQVFYQQVKWVLKKPNGVIAAWCYSEPKVNDAVDAICLQLEKESAAPFWAQPQRKYLDDRFMTIDFPFEPVEGEDHTGPFEFEAMRSMDLESYLSYIRTWSAYQTALGQGVELLTDDVVNDFERAWGADRKTQKMVRYPIYLRIGRVGTE